MIQHPVRVLVVLLFLAVFLSPALGAQDPQGDPPEDPQPAEPQEETGEGTDDPDALQPPATVQPVAAATPTKTKSRFRAHGEVRFRGDFISNYTDFNDDGGFFDPMIPLLVDDDLFDYYPYRVRVALEADVTENILTHFELQAADLAGNDQEQRDVLFSNIDNIDLYTGYVDAMNLGGSEFAMRFGRQEIVMGNELLFGNLDYYNGISFDGFRLYWDGSPAQFQFWWARTEETLQFDAQDNIWTVSIDGQVDRGDDWSFYAHWVRNDGISGIDRLSLLVVGFRWTRMEAPERQNHYIWSFEFVFQDGRIGNPEIPPGSGLTGEDIFLSAWAFEGWFGYDWDKESQGHKVYFYGYLATGNRDLRNRTVNDFNPLFQDFHYRLGRADLVQGTNINSIALFYEGRIGERNEFGVSWNGFEINQEQHAPTQLASIPGRFDGLLIAPSLGAAKDLGQEVDVWYDYYLNKYLSFDVALSVFLPGTAIKDATGGFDDPVTRLAAQVRARW